MGKNDTAKYALKKMFGLESLEHNDDFMGYVFYEEFCPYMLLTSLTPCLVFLKMALGFGNLTASTQITPASTNFVMLSKE